MMIASWKQSGLRWSWLALVVVVLDQLAKLAILDGLHALYRDPRYRPSPWLVRRARLGVSLLTPEA